MKKVFSLFTLVALGCFACQTTSPEEGAQSEEDIVTAPTIEGTYRLVSRELPDGTIQEPPEIVGLITYAKRYRNFNIYSKDAEGKSSSSSYIATYNLTEESYSEESIYRMVNDEAGDGLSYDLSGPTGSSPVTISDGKIEFQLPLYDEPSIVFEGKRATATRSGAFVDRWEKVE